MTAFTPENTLEKVTPDKATQISKPIVAAGFIVGLLLSFGVLSGDDAGRVNLLYLLLIFLFIPVASVIISLLSLIKGKGINFARLMSHLPMWSNGQQRYLHKLRQMHLDKQWCFLQSQAAALAYAAAGLLVLILLLLTTDINFVWRSTLLEADQLLPLLKLIATPWQFWNTAQPSLELLQFTQDSRLTQSYQDTTAFGQWWRFILATQLLYAFLLRGLLLAAGKLWIQHGVKSDVELKLSQQLNQHPRQTSHQTALAPITDALPVNFALTNWAGFDSDLLARFQWTPEQYLPASPIADEAVLSQAEKFSGDQLLLVKSWEPPMGELQDYMQHGQGLLFPINLVHNHLTAPEAKHLEEWQRFVNTLTDWKIYLPTDWIQADES